MADELTDILNPAEVRVLGSLIEKDITTPDYYPLTLNSLTNACNQSSNRDPVVSFSEMDVVRALDSLRAKKHAFMFQGADSRVSKYGHRFVESLGLTRPEAAVLCVLMLRGPQTLGEVRGRTGRMHEFENLEEVQVVLDALAARSPSPLVARLPRQSGMKEQRFAHLLSGAVPTAANGPEAKAEPAIAAVRLENERLDKLEADAVALRQEVAELKVQLDVFRKQFG